MIDIGLWRYRRFHISYLLGWLALGLLLGLIAAKVFNLSVGVLGYAVAATLLFPALKSRRWWAVVLVVEAGLFIGLTRATDYSVHADGYTVLIENQTSLSGVITVDPQGSGKGTQAFQLGHVKVGQVGMPGEVYVTTSSNLDLKRGDMVTVHGKVRKGFATFHASMSYASVVSVARSSSIIREIREKFVASVRSYVAEPMASLGIGFVVGQRSSLPQDLDEQLKVVGLTHIVVASGYNLTILVRFARRVLARHSRYLALVLSISLMTGFVVFSGFSPSMNRAVAVTGLSLLAWYYGRRFHPLLLILYVAAGTAMWNPVYIWSDLGWYLSFFAFAGVLIVAPLITTLFFKEKQPLAVLQLVIETLSAELMTLPLIALSFGVFPVFGLLANILVGPVIPFAMVATAIAGVTGMIAPATAVVASLPASVVIGYVVWVVEWLSAINWAQLSAGITMTAAYIWFTLLLFGCVAVWRRRKYNFRSSAITD